MTKFPSFILLFIPQAGLGVNSKNYTAQTILIKNQSLGQ